MDRRALPDPSGQPPALPADPACNQVVEILTAYLDGALRSDDQAALEDHLADCPYCEAYLEQLRLTIRLTGALHDHDVPEPLVDVLVSAFRRARQDP